MNDNIAYIKPKLIHRNAQNAYFSFILDQSSLPNKNFPSPYARRNKYGGAGSDALDEIAFARRVSSVDAKFYWSLKYRLPINRTGFVGVSAFLRFSSSASRLANVLSAALAVS